MYAWLDRLRPLTALIARLTLGAIFIVHGADKIFTPGALHGFTHLVAHLGMPAWLGYVAAFTEFLGGCLLVLGFLVPVAACGLAIDMAVAILKVHLHAGLTGQHGFQFPLALLALALMLLAAGPGYLALDTVVFGRR